MPVLCTNISPGLRVRTSLDTQRRLPYNPHTPPKPKRSPNDFAPSPAVTLTNNCTDRSGADLLKRRLDQGVANKRDESYMGYEIWLPRPPKVDKPRSVYNAASLAYIGDCIYEDALLQKLLNDNYLTEEERNVLRWGKNIGSAKTRSRKRAGVAVYNRASSLETLVDWFSVPDKCKSIGRSHAKAGIFNWIFYSRHFRGREYLTSRRWKTHFCYRR
ncbi:uncharacterized protein LOC110818393 isoform X10 [Carica papaya]|uniref:uncharacterized protein LOC110818393 isoform X10 n=1 Tax=Carica papaya TaxID=3649 RepID=UPI000B8C8BB6|nr:uncharacterized protein LOC110818393 isoform X10 [Carica papaya]